MREENPVSRLLDRLELFGILIFIALLSIYGVWRHFDPIGAARAATKVEVVLYDFLSSTVFDVVFVGGILLAFLLGGLYLVVVSIDFAGQALESLGLERENSLPDGPVGDYERDHRRRKTSNADWESLKDFVRNLSITAAVLFSGWYVADRSGFMNVFESVLSAVRTGSVSASAVLLALWFVVLLLIVYLVLKGVYSLLTRAYAHVQSRNA